MNQSFCTECGAKLIPKARFCVECGTSVAGTRGAAGKTWFSISRHGPLAVFATVFLVSAVAILFGTLAAKPPPRIPGQDPTGSEAFLPAGHPPLEIPQEMREKIRALEERVKAAPEDVEAWKQLGRAQYRSAFVEPSRFSAAAKAYDEALARDPNDTEALRMRGNIAFDTRQPREAIEYYQRYLARTPGDSSVMTDMGTMFLEAGDPNRAVQLFEEVLAKDPNFLQAQINLSVAYRVTGRNEDARAAMKKARDLAPDERLRKEIDEVLVEPPPSPGSTPAGERSENFRAAVESIFRAHPMLGQKLAGIDWPSDRNVRLMVRDFPMDAMPREVHDSFEKRIKEDLQAKKEAHQVVGEIRLDFVDSVSGRIMYTVIQ